MKGYEYWTVLETYKSYRNNDTMEVFMENQMKWTSGWQGLQVFDTKELAQDYARNERQRKADDRKYSRGPANGKYHIVVKRCNEYAEFPGYPCADEWERHKHNIKS